MYLKHSFLSYSKISFWVFQDLVAELMDKNDKIKQLNDFLQKKSSNLCKNCKKIAEVGEAEWDDSNVSKDLLDPSHLVKVCVCRQKHRR